MHKTDEQTNHAEIRLPTERPPRSVFLWLRQNYRRVQGRTSLQEEVLNKIVDELKEDSNLLGILLFGSVASGTQSWKSDIDLIIIYQASQPASGLVEKYVDWILVQYFFTTLDTLIENQNTVPYLLNMFSNAEILFDRFGSVTSVIKNIRQYYSNHPEVEAEWKRFKDLHQVEKNGPECAQTTIIHRWDELEEKYSGGVRKRTFFVSN